MAMPQEDYKSSELYRIRHSAAHVMAQAVMEMFPGQARIAIGPPIEDGFYYDFDLPRPLTPEDLEAIEARMRQIIAEDQTFVRQELSAEEARRLFADQPYKIELIDGLEAGGRDEYGAEIDVKPEISIYKDGSFVDLCRGPHVEHTGQINPAALKLLSVAGAYWRGDEKNPMLQRIYGTAWNDGRGARTSTCGSWRRPRSATTASWGVSWTCSASIRGRRPGAGPLAPQGRDAAQGRRGFLPRRAPERGGYELVYTPHIGRANLWETSGHLGFYRENMYSPVDIEGQEYFLKPMNCPFHIQIYKSRTRSYRDLPLALCRMGHGLPLRAERRAARPDARARLHPGRCPPLLPAGPDAGGDRPRARRSACSILRAFGFQDFQCLPVDHAPRQVGRNGGAVGGADRGAATGARTARGSPTGWTRAGRVLRPEDRPQGHGRHRPRVAAAARSSSTSTCRSAST